MELIRGIHNIRARHHGCVLTIGNFDGVHRGHQALLEQLKQQGQRLGLPVMVMIFEPQPLEMFAADKAPARLTRLRDKANYLAQAGVDYLLCVKFDPRFAANTAQAFVAELLVEKLGVKFLMVGDDFRFGAGRRGDFPLLQQAGKEYGFEVVSTPTFREGDRRISSTAIRTALVRTICRWRRPCWATRTASPGAWCMATSWAAPSASRPPTCRSSAWWRR